MNGRTLDQLAAHVGGRVFGDGNVFISGIAPIDEAKPGEITFLTNSRYQKYLSQCRASAVIVGPGVISESAGTVKNFLEAADPYVAFAKILSLLRPSAEFSPQISPLAAIHASAVVATSSTIFPNVFIGPRARVGERAVLFPGVYLGEDVSVGVASVLHANVVVREGCRIGERVILHPGVVIGCDGFGYAGRGAARIKIPQVGIVVVEDDVEIGANTTVDRATLGRTVIRRGAKIDNLVQIAHNVQVGEYSVIASQAGVAGSTKLGKNVTLAGQVGVVNHIEIGEGATIGPQSGVPQNVAPGAVLSGGIAAAPHHEWLKVMALLPQLPTLWNMVRRLEKDVRRLVTTAEKESGGDAGR